MRSALGIIAALGCLFVPGPEAIGSPSGQDARSSPPGQVARELRYSVTSVMLRDGRKTAGFLAGAGPDELILMRDGKDERIPRAELLEVRIEREQRAIREILPQTMLLFYGGNIASSAAAGREDGEFYLRAGVNVWSLALQQSILFGTSVGLGLLTRGLFSPRETIFDFAERGPQASRQWERLRRTVLGLPVEKKLRFSFRGGYVLQAANRRLEACAAEAGYGLEPYRPRAGLFSLFRQAAVTYSIRPALEVGLAFMALGEPRGWYDKTETVRMETWYGLQDYLVYSHAETKFSSTGVFAVVAARPFAASMPKRCAWRIGLGAGALKSEYRLSAEFRKGGAWQLGESAAAKTAWGALASTEFDLRLTNSLEIGLAADYVFGPSIEFPGLPEAGFPARRLRSANGSLGFSTSWSF